MENVMNPNFENFFNVPKKKGSDTLFNSRMMAEVFNDVRISVKKYLIPLNLQNKLNSEIVSDLIVKKLVGRLNDCGSSAKSGRGDNDADFYIGDIPYEVKVTMGKNWRGGEFSKRVSNYVLIIRNTELKSLRFCAILVHLSLEDWKSSQHENYYATELKLEDVLKKPHSVIYGDIKQNKVIFE